MNDLLALLPATKSTWLLIVTCITGVAFTLSAIACDRLGHKLISALLAAGAWLSAAFAAFVWFWRLGRASQVLKAPSRPPSQGRGPVKLFEILER